MQSLIQALTTVPWKRKAGNIPHRWLWTMHGDFEIQMRYPNDVVMQISGKEPQRCPVRRDGRMDIRIAGECRRYSNRPVTTEPQWTRLFGPRGGMRIQEIHQIERVVGNRVKFKNPIQFDLTLVDAVAFELREFVSLAECGVEDILFTSNWHSYPEDFVHHKDAIHDSG